MAVGMEEMWDPTSHLLADFQYNQVCMTDKTCWKGVFSHLSGFLFEFSSFSVVETGSPSFSLLMTWSSFYFVPALFYLGLTRSRMTWNAIEAM